MTGQRDAVAEWVAGRIRDMGGAPKKDFEAIGVVQDGRIIGGVVYTNYRRLADGEYDIQMTCAGEGPWLTKSSLRRFFVYPFEQLRCIRVTSVVAKANSRSRDLAERLGFKLEGRVTDGYGTGRHGLIYGLTKASCRWIKG